MRFPITNTLAALFNFFLIAGVRAQQNASTTDAAKPSEVKTAATGAGEQTKQVFKFKKNGQDASLGYWLALPKLEQKTTAAPPMVLFLHGAGERGDNLDVVKKHGPPMLISKGQNKWLAEAVVVSPQCPKGEWWDTKALKDLCDEVVKTHKVDTARIYLTGLSMGGFASWTLLAEQPDFWAAAIPICGGGKPETAEKFKHVPLWVFHGAKDSAVELVMSENMIQALKAASAKPEPKFTVYPDEAHESWTPAYASEDTWKWLFEQKLSVKK